MRTSVLLTIVRYLRHGSSGESAPSGLSSKSLADCRPAPRGSCDAPQVFEPAAPCTDSMATNRVLSPGDGASRDRLVERAQRRHHRVEVGQRDGRAQSAKERATLQCLSSEDLHGPPSPESGCLVLLFRVGRGRCVFRSLASGMHCCSTTPITNDENR